MDKPKQLLWNKLEANEATKTIIPSSNSYPVQTILLGDHLICFLSQRHIYICELLSLSWMEAIDSTLIDFESLSGNSPICVIDQTTLIAFGTYYETFYVGHKPQKMVRPRLKILSIDKAQTPWKMGWKMIDCQTDFPIRKQNAAQAFKSKIYAFGGKDENDSIKNDLLIIDSKTFAYFPANPKIKPNKRYGHSSLIHNGKFFIYGGVTENNMYLNDIWAWNLTDNSNWECIFSNERFTNGLIPAPSSFSLMQGFENTLVILQKNKECTSHTLLSYDMDSSSWEHFNLNEDMSSESRLHTFAVHNNKFIIGKNFDLYEADLFCQGSLITSKPRKENNIINDYKKLFIGRQFCDITFKVEGEEIPAHKAILAQRSGYFMKMFTSKMLESQSQTIEVPEIKCSVFKALLEFLYCDSTNITEEIALDLFKLSDEYQLEELKENCEKFIRYHIRPTSAIDIFLVADKLEAFKMRKTALQYIIANIQAINEVDKISRLGDSVLCELIDRKSD